MRIPWYIYSPLCLIITFGTLFLYSKDTDVVTPPSKEVILVSLQKWKENNPSLKRTQLPDFNPTTDHDPKPETNSEPVLYPTATPKEKPTTKPTNKPKTEPKIITKITIPETSPSLESLVQLNLTTQQLTSYAELTLKNNKPQLARIAYERIIDSSKDATDEDKKSAAQSIGELLDKTPLWNPDLSTRKELTLNLTLNSIYDSKAIISELETLIFESSDGTINPAIKLTPSTEEYSSLDLGNGTPIVKFKPENQPDLLSKIHTALYYSIRTKNNQSQKLTSTPPIPTHISPKKALQTYITRLAWVNAAN
jgi:hypothetical protein